jgi:hypothetical protein
LRLGDEGRARGTRRGKRVALWVLAASVALVASLGALAWAVSGYREVAQTPAAIFEEARGAFDGSVEIPDVVGLGRAEAQGRLVRAGFEVAIRPRESREADAGEVLGQSLPGGERADEGAGISLDVGEGPRTVPAPDLSGLTLDEARAVLDEAGLTPGDVNEAPSDTVPEGAVLEQDPPAGEDLEPEARVGLTVSSGPEQSFAPEPVPLAPGSPAPEPAPQQYAAEPYYEPAPTPAPQQYEPVPGPVPSAEPSADAKSPVPRIPNLSGFPFGGGGDERKRRDN